MFCVLCAIYQQDYAYDKRRYFKLDSRFFVPQGRHIAPIGVELSADECHLVRAVRGILMGNVQICTKA